MIAQRIRKAIAKTLREPSKRRNFSVSDAIDAAINKILTPIIEVGDEMFMTCPNNEAANNWTKLTK